MASRGAPAAQLAGAIATERVAPSSDRAEQLHRLAMSELSAGRSSGAEALLQEALQLAPRSAAIVSDLGVAEMALGRIPDAAEHFGAALDLDGENRPAAFNWALALEKLSLRHAAIAAWIGYLQLDGTSEWAREAQRHVETLSTPRPTWEKERELLRPGVDLPTVQRLAQQYPQRVRARSQNVLLPAWAVSGDAGELEVIRAIALERRRDDPYLFDIVEHASRNRDAVASGLRAFGAAFRADHEGKPTEALGHYEDAAKALGSRGSPLAIGASIYAASLLARNGRREEALARLRLVSAELDLGGNRYPAMAAEVEWVRGIALMQLGRSQQSLEAFRAAKRHATDSGEIEHAAAVAAMFATDLELLIDPAEADAYQLEALRKLDEIQADPARMRPTFADAGYSALRAGRPHVALAFLESAAHLARGIDSQMTVQTMTQRAYGLFRLGRREAARKVLDTAYDEALRLNDGVVRDHEIAQIDYVKGLVYLKDRPDLALASFQQSIERNDKNEFYLEAAAAHVARGEAALATGSFAEAERAFHNGIAEIERQRADLGEQGMRIAYFERADRAFDDLIALLLSQHRDAEALSVAERKRARSLLEQISASSNVQPLDETQIAAAFAGNQALLELSLSSTGVEAWLVQDGRITHASSTAARPAIEEAVKRHLAAIDAGDLAGVQREGRWLYDQIIAPAGGRLGGSSSLVIVADDILQTFPFATLSAADGRYLFQDHSLVVSPSASIFVRGGKWDSGNAKVLAVAEPAPPGLDRLTHVAAECASIVRTYGTGHLYVGGAISPDTFLAEATDADLVHFGGHSRLDVRTPSQSALLFEADGDTPAELTAVQIGRARLTRHPLVVLAACSTGRGKVRRNEGTASLAGAFLQAGARGVVATLWDIDDALSARLFRIFHAELRRGAKPAEALRRAQNAFLHSADPDERSAAAWGGAVVMGTF